MKFFFALITVSLLFTSCKKVEGKGGLATIKGFVYKQKYNSLGNPINGGRYASADQDIFLIYGEEDNFYDDDIKSSYDGSFEFNYLQKGKYTLFVYEDCSTCQSGKIEKIYPIEITERKQVIDLDTIEVKKQL